MLNVRPNTITKRLEKAGYAYYRGKWILEAEKPGTKPMSEEEKEAMFRKLKQIL